MSSSFSGLFWDAESPRIEEHASVESDGIKLEPRDLDNEFSALSVDCEVSSSTALTSPASSRSCLSKVGCEVCGLLTIPSSSFYPTVCEGCKAFFKRSIQGNAKYICMESSNCEIMESGRGGCPSCRLKRCIDVGMTSDGSKRYTNAPPSQLTRSTLYRSENSAAGLLLQRLVEIEFQVIAADLGLPGEKDDGDARGLFFNFFAILADRMLNFLVEWAKSVPGYTALSIGSQRALLERCYFDQMVLTVAYHSTVVTDHQIRLSADMVFTQDALIDICGGEFSRCHQELFAVCQCFKKLNISLSELVGLRATQLVFSDDDVQTEDRQYLASLQDKVLDALSYAAHESIEDTPAEDQGNLILNDLIQKRQTSLLQVLSRIKRLSGWILGELNCLQRQDRYVMYELMRTMLSAHP